MVVGGKVRGEQPHGGEVDRTLGEQVEDHGEPAGGASGVDTVVGLVLGQTEYVPAVDEEGGEALRRWMSPVSSSARWATS